jgi:hypothetical protein
VLGSNDNQVLQVLGLLEEECDDLAQRGDWQQLTYEATHTTVATESQGDINTIATNGFDRIRQNTLWDRDLSLPLYVVDDVDWQQIKANNVTGPRYQVRLRGDELISTPAPTAGHTWAFEYISKNWAVDSGGSTYDSEFNDDDDEILLPNKIVKMGLRWRWKKEKGFDYDEDFQTYEKMIEKALGSNKLRRNLNLSERPTTPQPKIYVPEGNWGV